MTPIFAADLFCGAGGFSTGLLQATKALGYQVDLLAVNHWPVAIATHASNHPGVRHMCQTLDEVNPRKVVPGGHLHLLMAAPECTHHSNARGGKPMSDQSRATAWHICRWAEALTIDNILIENVREFLDWGPLHPCTCGTQDPREHADGANCGRPVEAEKGKYFHLFLKNLRCLGYTVEHRILNAAHYGDATTRQRLFVQARKGRKRIKWPVLTHHKPAGADALLEAGQPWRPAREIIDWSQRGVSIYHRKRPLSPNTMRRILAGLEKYSGLPFTLGVGGPTGAARPQSVEIPLGTVPGDDHRDLCEPYLCEPYLVVLRNNQDAQSLNAPLGTITTSGAHFALCEPYIIQMAHSTCTDNKYNYPLNRPLPTVTGKNSLAVIEPFLVPFYTEHDKQKPRVCSVDNPLGTVTTENRYGLAEPFLVKYNGTGGAYGVDAPLDTITGKDRFGLVTPELIDQGQVALLDILFRMLTPKELAAAMSFPEDYHFEGSRAQQVKQIGNAVAVRTAQALCTSILNLN